MQMHIKGLSRAERFTFYQSTYHIQNMLKHARLRNTVLTNLHDTSESQGKSNTSQTYLRNTLKQLVKSMSVKKAKILISKSHP